MIENKRWLTIKLDELDIQYGQPQNGLNCPIRKRLHKMGFKAPKVYKGVVSFTDPDTMIRYYWEYPPEMYKWLVRYDRGENVEIPTFRLDLHTAIQRPPLPMIIRTKRTNRTLAAKSEKAVPKGHLRPIETW